MFALSTLTLLSLWGCTPTSRIAEAAAVAGKARAGVVLPILPGECRQAVPHAPARLGDDAVATWARERQQLDLANGVIMRCADNYDTLKADLEAGG